VQDTKLIYRHFATLYFVVLCDRSESELGILDLIQGPSGAGRMTHCPEQALLTPPSCGVVYVETLDRSFESVCELDLIFNSPKVKPLPRGGAGCLALLCCGMFL
jgi:AP-3 complex subunit sigma